MTVAYTAVAIGVGGAADIFLPGLGAPDWALSTVLALLLLGIPVAGVLAWAYDLGPEGVRRTAVEGDPGASPDLKAIAVLPFTNLSEDPGNEYFSDGMTEDILTHLSKIPDLHVISRTSAMTYKGSAAPLGQIARELGVGTVLEGSVRRAGDRVRVVAQLIEARTDRHLWAETYDRDLDDIFAVQSDIAKQIAKALHARLAPAVLSHILARPSEDMRAYELFVRGRHDAFSVRPDRIPRGIEQLEEAVSLDPGFAPALATLGAAHLIAAYWGGATPLDAFRQAKEAGQRAIELDERSAVAWAVTAVARAHYDYDWPGATKDARHAVRLGPSDRDAHFWAGFILILQERFDEALPFYEQARALDPHDPAMQTHLALATWLLGREDEAEPSFRRIAEAHPAFADVHAVRAVPLSRDGRWLEYAEANEKGAELTGGHPIFRARQALGLRRAGRVAEAEELVEDVVSGAGAELPSNIRMVLALAAGDSGAAADALDAAITERQPMVLWHRLARTLPLEEGWVRERLERVWATAVQPDHGQRGS